MPENIPKQTHWPPGSLLSVPPLEIGTPRVESLAGYLTRLAAAHAVPARILTARIFRSALPQLGNASERAIYGRRGAWINGAGLWAQEVSATFAELTAQRELARLTMLPWKNVLSLQGFSASVRRWCPECYSEMEHATGDRWDLLLWSLNSVRSCARHELMLASRCPKCGREQSWLSADTAVGWCTLCGHDLSADRITRKRKSCSSSLTWSAEVCGEMLAHGSAAEMPLVPGRISTGVRNLVESLDEGNISAFARRVGVVPNTVKHWMRAGTIHLDTLLMLCARIGLRPLDFFTAENVMDAGRTHDGLSGRRAPCRERWNRRDWNKVAGLLKSILEQQPEAALKDIAAELKVSTGLLRTHFPDQVAKLSARKRLVRGKAKKPKVTPSPHRQFRR